MCDYGGGLPAWQLTFTKEREEREVRVHDTLDSKASWQAAKQLQLVVRRYLAARGTAEDLDRACQQWLTAIEKERKCSSESSR